MEKLIQRFDRKIATTSTVFSRYLLDEINWNDRLIAIIGLRGVIKTTLLFQYTKRNHAKSEEARYTTLDDIYVQFNLLTDPP